MADVEDVFVFRPIRADLLFLLAPVKVQDVDVGERLHERLTHASMGDTIDVGVVGDECEDARAGALDSPLGEPDELDEVVVQVELLLVQVLLVIFE